MYVHFFGTQSSQGFDVKTTCDLKELFHKIESNLLTAQNYI